MKGFDGTLLLTSLADNGTGKFLRDACAAFLILMPPFLLCWHSITGDGCIYFTFIKNFFAVPFSYQPNTVSFGATSPLHVVIHGIVYQLFGESHWLQASKVVNYLLIVGGVVFLQRSINTNMRTLLIVAVVTTLNVELFNSSAALYETSLAFFAMSLLYYLLKNQSFEQAVLLSGALYLVRPELVLITVIVDTYVLVTYSTRKTLSHIVRLISLSMVPVIVYHAYLFIYTQELLPSSIYGKQIRAAEEGLSWMERIMDSIKALGGKDRLTYFGTMTKEIIYFLGILTVGVIAFQKRLGDHKEELMLLIPIVVFYTALPPPHGEITRYLLSATPAMIAIIAVTVLRYLTKFQALCASTGLGLKSFFANLAYVSLIPLTLAITSPAYVYKYSHPRYDYDTMLQLDLAEKLNAITDEKDKILIYEIQGQYYLRAACYSLDGLVGGQLRDVLMGMESFENYISRNNIKFIVTMNGLDYRKVFKNTLLVDLYVHDLSSDVGDSVRIRGITFKKVFTNQVFSNPRLFKPKKHPYLNVGKFLRVYGDWNGLWEGYHPVWNSVYAVTKKPLVPVRRQGVNSDEFMESPFM